MSEEIVLEHTRTTEEAAYWVAGCLYVDSEYDRGDIPVDDLLAAYQSCLYMNRRREAEQVEPYELHTYTDFFLKAVRSFRDGATCSIADGPVSAATGIFEEGRE